MSWYVSRNGHSRGPLEEAEVSAQIRTGSICRGDYLSLDGGNHWFPIEEAAGFRELLPAAQVVVMQQQPYLAIHAGHYYQQAPVLWLCPSCGSDAGRYLTTKVSTNGWIMFAISLVFCFPLFFVGLMQKENVMLCRACRCRIT